MGGGHAQNPAVGERDVVWRDEVQSAVEARRELGPDYEDHIVDALVDSIERRLAEREQPSGFDPRMLPIALGSLGLAIPLTAVAASNVGLAAVIVVWIGIVFVNLAASGTLRSRRRPRR